MEAFGRFLPFFVFILLLFFSYGSSMPEELFKLEPDSAEKYYNIGRAYFDKKDYDNAIEYYNKAIKLAKGTYKAKMYRYIAYAYARKNSYDKVIESCEKSIELEPSNAINAEEYIKIGFIYGEKFNDHNKAIDYYKKAIVLKPDYATAYNNLCYSYAKMQFYDRALKYCEKAIELEPNSPFAQYGIGIAYDGKKDYDKANEHYKKSIELKPDTVVNAMTYIKIGFIYGEKFNDHNKAIEYYSKAIKLKPDYAMAYNNLCYSHAKIRLYDKALNYCKKAIELNPNSPWAQHSIGFTYAGKKDYDKAIEHYKKVIELSEKTPDYDHLAQTYYNMSEVYEAKGDKAQGLECKKKAQELGW
jgi:tetratricopeptide (TPR) repeat protein